MLALICWFFHPHFLIFFLITVLILFTTKDRIWVNFCCCCCGSTGSGDHLLISRWRRVLNSTELFVSCTKRLSSTVPVEGHT